MTFCGSQTDSNDVQPVGSGNLTLSDYLHFFELVSSVVENEHKVLGSLDDKSVSNAKLMDEIILFSIIVEAVLNHKLLLFAETSDEAEESDDMCPFLGSLALTLLQLLHKHNSEGKNRRLDCSANDVQIARILLI
ncbi:hypothetical protein NECAME_07110 [Necator americanus]|uniref:Uncharacterized protein n=1 Tax=Necator americanus TaxID=51031 RepID=W2TQQ9_NECAM|nr:hypothetical protein NECAME_07110 [Necator americanus]ETN84014.1 hypothetical protein NECAME_07110 [Necator americanus]